MRELKAGDRCERTIRIGSPHIGYTDTRCEAIHLSRVDGKPVQLILIKEGRAYRKICTRCAPIAEMKNTTTKQKRSTCSTQQVSLL